jgi:hypothetical protein
MLILIAAVVVGSHACQACHPAISQAYARTPMARSAGRTDTIPEADFTAAGHKYRTKDKLLSFDGGTISADYFIGSNTAGRTYLSERDGYLFELPVTWYVRKHGWDASPGYENDTEVRANRPVEPSCLGCHTSGVRPVLGTQNRYGDPPFLENGVGCERCHGPGSEHVRDPLKARMVNPAALDPERRDSICSQCHLTGEARVERPNHRVMDFRAGELLADYATWFVWNLGRRDLKVTSHVEKLAGSMCKRASGDVLWCGTCHDVHTNADKTQAACVSCHPTAHHAEEQCAGCHMPKTQAIDASHGVLTNHGIPRLSNSPSPPVGHDLTPFLGTADDRAFGIAYAELGDRRAREYLLHGQPSDAQVRLRLASLEPDPASATALYESVLRSNPAESVALVNLGALYAEAGRTAEAGRLWERALVTNPGLEAAVLNLSGIRPAAAAREILSRYLDLNPGSAAARSRLAGLQKQP